MQIKCTTKYIEKTVEKIGVNSLKMYKWQHKKKEIYIWLPYIIYIGTNHIKKDEKIEK